MTYIKIENCSECASFDEKRDYTADSFEMCFRGYCNKAKKGLWRYRDWNQKMPPVPEWCPKRKK